MKDTLESLLKIAVSLEGYPSWLKIVFALWVCLSAVLVVGITFSKKGDSKLNQDNPKTSINTVEADSISVGRDFSLIVNQAATGKAEATSGGIQYRKGNFVILDGMQGSTKDAQVVVKGQIVNHPFPPVFELNLLSARDRDWKLTGVKYSYSSGSFELFFKNHPSLSPQGFEARATFFAEGYRQASVILKHADKGIVELEFSKPTPYSIDRVTVLETDESNDSLVLDIVYSNQTEDNIWIEKMCLIGFGTSNMVCNPNPIGTYHYEVSLDIVNDRIQGQVRSPNDSISIPVTGALQHNYCDGFIVLSFPQTIKIPAKEKVSYIMTISDLNLILKEIDSSKRWAEIVEKQKQEHLNNARDVSARNYFLNMEPSFYAPAWSSMMIVSQLDSGNLIGGRFVQGSWHSDYRVLSIPELQKSGFTDDQIEEILRLADTPM